MFRSAEDIIQFLYGEDGMDGLWIEELAARAWRPQSLQVGREVSVKWSSMQDQTLEIMTYDNRKLENTFQPGSSDFGCSFVGTGLSISAFSGTSTLTQTTGSVGCRPRPGAD